MKHIRLQLIPIQELNQNLHSHDGMHSDYFREFVQMMLCHAWSIGFLSSDLWDAIPDIAQAATMHDIGKTALPETIIHKRAPFLPQNGSLSRHIPSWALPWWKSRLQKCGTIRFMIMRWKSAGIITSGSMAGAILTICAEVRSHPMFRSSVWPMPTMHSAVPEAIGMR